MLPEAVLDENSITRDGLLPFELLSRGDSEAPETI